MRYLLRHVPLLLLQHREDVLVRQGLVIAEGMAVEEEGLGGLRRQVGHALRRARPHPVVIVLNLLVRLRHADRLGGPLDLGADAHEGRLRLRLHVAVGCSEDLDLGKAVLRRHTGVLGRPLQLL